MRCGNLIACVIIIQLTNKETVQTMSMIENIQTNENVQNRLFKTKQNKTIVQNRNKKVLNVVKLFHVYNRATYHLINGRIIIIEPLP
jgi:hypothetical protein